MTDLVSKKSTINLYLKYHEFIPNSKIFYYHWTLLSDSMQKSWCLNQRRQNNSHQADNHHLEKLDLQLLSYLWNCPVEMSRSAIKIWNFCNQEYFVNGKRRTTLQGHGVTFSQKTCPFIAIIKSFIKGSLDFRSKNSQAENCVPKSLR